MVPARVHAALRRCVLSLLGLFLFAALPAEARTVLCGAVSWGDFTPRPALATG